MNQVINNKRYNSIDSIFDTFFNPIAFNNPLNKMDHELDFYPNTNIQRNESEYIISIELAGIDKKNIDIKANNNELTITGEKKLLGNKNNYYRIESSYGKFQRTFIIPTDINQDKIKAKYKNGVLILTMPFKEEIKANKILTIED